jgi:cytochrome c oxidase cbb3-type subunit 3
MSAMRAIFSGIFLAFIGFCAVACRREERRFSEPMQTSELRANPVTASRADQKILERYAKDAWAINEGQRLFGQMNCAGCHGHGGGGGIAPPLMDAKWLYGSGLSDIERTILSGSARGMPSFDDKLTRQQVWQLVAYVRSLSGHAPSAAAPVRDDHMAVRPPPSRTKPEPPTQQSVD